MPEMKKIRIESAESPHWPRWFKQSAYKQFRNCTGEEILIQLLIRKEILNGPKTKNGRLMVDDRKWRAITEGQPRIDDLSQKLRGRTESNAVISVNHASLELIQLNVQKNAEYKLETGPYRNFICPLFPRSKAVLFSVDLEAADNQTILKELERQIIEARGMQRIPEPSDKKKQQAGKTTLKNFINYQIIAYLDLLIYCSSHSYSTETNWKPLELSYPMLTALLFDKLTNPQKLERTVAAFLHNKFFDDSYFNKLTATVLGTPKLAHTKVSEL